MTLAVAEMADQPGGVHFPLNQTSLEPNLPNPPKSEPGAPRMQSQSIAEWLVADPRWLLGGRGGDAARLVALD